MPSLRKAVRLLAILPIRLYQLGISPLLPPSCRFVPTCSAYAIEAITRHGHTLHLQSPFVGDLGVEKLYLEMKSGLFTSVFGLEITIGGAAI